MPNFYRDDITKALPIEAPVIKISPVSQFNFTPVKETKYEGGYYFRYLNPSKNSRLESDFPDNKIWNIKWKAALAKDVIPWYLLLSDGKIIVQNESGWELFDAGGKLITNGIKDEGNISIDPGEKLFFMNDFTGYLKAVELGSGQTRFYIYPYMGKGYNRSIIRYNNSNFISIGFALPVMTHKSADQKPDIILIESMDIHNQSEIDNDKILLSGIQIQKLICRAYPVVSASNEGQIFLAARDNIVLIDSELNVKSILEGHFIPVEISLDEKSIIYLIAKVTGEDNSEKMHLMVITPDGKLISDTELEDFGSQDYYPPVVGYDHSVYINDGISAAMIDSKGNKQWQIRLGKNSPGSSAAKNNFVLTPEGDLLTALDKEGERHFIYHFEGEILSTPPLLTPENKVYIATKNFLYCLEPVN